jgi:hypothetical protein
MPGALVLVDRGDGHRFKVHERQVEKWLARNPGGFVVSPTGSTATTPARAAHLTAVGEAGELEKLTIDELMALAAERRVEVPSRPKAAIVAALEDALKSEEEDEDGDAEAGDGEGAE